MYLQSSKVCHTDETHNSTMSPSVAIFLVLCHLSVVVQPHTSNTAMASYTSYQLKILKWPPEVGHSFNHNGTAAVVTGHRYPRADVHPQYLPQWYSEDMDGLIMARILNYNVDKHGLQRWEDIGSSQQLIPDILQQRVHPWCLHCRSKLPPGRSPEPRNTCAA